MLTNLVWAMSLVPKRIQHHAVASLISRDSPGYSVKIQASRFEIKLPWPSQGQNHTGNSPASASLKQLSATSDSSIWELVRNAGSWAPAQTQVDQCNPGPSTAMSTRNLRFSAASWNNPHRIVPFYSLMRIVSFSHNALCSTEEASPPNPSSRDLLTLGYIFTSQSIAMDRQPEGGWLQASSSTASQKHCLWTGLREMYRTQRA